MALQRNDLYHERTRYIKDIILNLYVYKQKS